MTAPPTIAATAPPSADPDGRGARDGPVSGGRARVLFIGGIGRSGSTLIEKLLNELPTMVAVGETVHLWERGVRDRERCGCGEPFERCPRWSAIGEAAFGGWDQVDTDEVIGLRWRIDRTRRLPQIAAALRRGEPTADQRRYLDHLSATLGAAAAIGAAPLDGADVVVIDSSKHLSTAALLALDDRLDVRILHVVRDPRGVAHSWTKRVARPETDGELMPRYPPARSAGRWLTDNLGFDALAQRVPTMRLRYEDFAAAPATNLRAIAAFCGVPLGGETDGPGPDPIDRIVTTSSPTAAPTAATATVTLRAPMHSVAGNPLRFGGDTITIRPDDGWRRNLAPADRRLVTTITAPLLTRYGYPLLPRA